MFIDRLVPFIIKLANGTMSYMLRTGLYLIMVTSATTIRIVVRHSDWVTELHIKTGRQNKKIFIMRMCWKFHQV